MPWIPTNDFEEEVVNLQPHHDFIYGVLSEPQYSYPRPKAHTEYAAVKKSEPKQKSQSSNSGINGKLHAIQQVQRIANTKPIGEQPTIDDWENNTKIEQETIGMMRYCGLGVSVEQPLNEKVTIATFPVENKIKLVQNGRRKVALYFDENVFKLKEKVSDTSSGFDSFNNSENKAPDDHSLLSGAKDNESTIDTSFDSSSFVSTSSVNTFTTAGENSDTFSSSLYSYQSTPATRHLKVKTLQKYDKLLEETTALSLNESTNSSMISTNTSCSYNSSSKTDKMETFKTAENTATWCPIYIEEENLFKKQENWPNLERNKNLWIIDAANRNSTDDIDNVNNNSSNISMARSSSNQIKRTNFLDRFIKPEYKDNFDSSAAANTPTITYANITKVQNNAQTSISSSLSGSESSKQNKDENNSDFIRDFQPFYTARKMYALKRNVK